MKKLLLLTTLISMLSACQSVLSPMPEGVEQGLVDGAPAGTAAFRYGWKDGCESGMATYGAPHYKAVYDFTYDTDLINDREYHQAWQVGFRHCKWYTIQS